MMKSKNVYFIFFIIFGLCLFQPSYAVRVKGLYTAKIRVSEQTRSLRHKVLPKALLQVLVKVSGNEAISTLPMVQHELKKASQLVERYQYYKKTDDDNKPYILQVKFSKKAVNHILQQSGQAIWSQDRPTILAWLLIIEDGKQPYVLGNDSESIIYQTLKEQTNSRGLPMIFPLLDLTDLNNISINDLENFKLDVIQKNSERYQANAILVGQIEKQKNGHWKGQWQLRLDNETIDWETQGKELLYVVDKEIDNITNTLAPRYSVLSTDESENHVTLKITHINDLINYAKVTEYLKKLTPVRQVSILELANDNVVYQLELSGSLEALQKALALDDRLIEEGHREDGLLIYRWS